MSTGRDRCRARDRDENGRVGRVAGAGPVGRAGSGGLVAALAAAVAAAGVMSSSGTLGICLAASGCAGPAGELGRGGGSPASGRSASGKEGTQQIGKATYYAPGLAGRRTASGERYDPMLFTAAHPLWPFGTKVAVERTDVDLPPVVVRINDRCAGGKKIIDLSEAAAKRLQMMRAGIVPVRLRVIHSPARRSQ